MQRQRETSMATNRREHSREARISKETFERLAYVGKISPTIASARTNTGEISGSSSVQHQRETSVTTNPRENSKEERISRETSARLGYVRETSPTIASKKKRRGETSGSSSVQRHREISMATNPKEASGRLGHVGETSPTIASA